MDNSNIKKTSKIKGLLTVVLLIVLGIFLILVGIKYYKVSSKEYILSNAIKNVYTKLKSNIKLPTLIKSDNYSLTSTIQYNTTNNTTLNTNLLSYLSNANTKLTLIHSKDNKKLFLDINTNKDNTDIINYKKYIENSTNYVKVEEVSNNYINLGNDNYFENFSKDDNTISNIDYIITKYIELIPISLTEDNLAMTREKVLVNKEEKSVYKITYSIDNHELVKLINKLKNNIKNDKKAYSILTNYDKDYFNKTVEEKDKLLKSKQQIIINVYTDYFYNIIKYEIEFLNDLDSKIYSLDVVDNNILLTTLKNHKVINYFEITKSNNKYLINVKNSKEEDVGSIEFENDKLSTSLILSYSDDTYKHDILLDRKLTENNYGYNEVIKYDQIKTNLSTTNKDLVTNCIIINNVSNEVKIEEEVKDSILLDSLSKDKKKIMTNYKKYLKNKLNS